MASYGSLPNRPDFAFPEKVSVSAEKNLAAALAAGNDVAALRAALNLALAQNAIDSDRMPGALAMLDSVAGALSSPASRAVCDLMQATIYSAYYRSQQWSIDQRPELAAGAQPSANYAQWNRAQFEARICELLNAALANPEALLNSPLRTYDSLLAVSAKEARLTYLFYPSLLDFIGNQAIDILSTFRTASARELVGEYRALLTRLNAGHPAPYAETCVNDILGRSTSVKEMRSALMALYSSLSDSEYSGEALIALGNITDPNDIDACRELKELIDAFLRRYPSYIRINNLKNLLASITRPRIELTYRSLVVPGNELTFSATSYNTSSVNVTLYRLPDNYIDNGNDYYPLKNGVIPSTFKAVANRKLTFGGKAPFKSGGSDSIPIADAGLYILVAHATDLDRDNNPCIIRATHLAAGSIAFGKSVSAMVVNPLTGCPVPDARILRYDKQHTTSDLGTTDSDGMLPLNMSERGNLLFRPVKGSDTFAPMATVWNTNRNGLDSTRRYNVEAFTDLALYHPGDTMRFAAILYSVRGQEIGVTPGETVEAVVYDANRQPVDTIRSVTDRFGRIEGSAVLPDDGRLNGRYYVVVSHGSATGRAYFTVSDYKLPSFEVIIDPAEAGVPEKGAVSLSGRAVAYSGMPVPDAEIAIRIEREYFWRYGFGQDSGFTPLSLTVKTDNEGRWSVVLTPAQLSGAGENAWFSASVTATSQTGESQAARTVFATGPALRIRAMLPGVIDIQNPVTLPVAVYGPSGSDVEGVKVDYAIIPLNDENAAAVASGSFISGKPVVDLSSVTPGTYTVTFTIDGDSRSCYGIALYRPDINRSPSSELLWTPDSKVTLSPGADTNILIGTSMDSTWVLYTLYDYERIIERRWIVLPAGLNRVTAATERGGSPGLRASFIASGQYTTRELDIHLEPAIDPRGLTLRAESMRDRIVPGTSEKWTFRVANALGTPVEAAVMIDMYNKALDAIMPSGWHLNVVTPECLYLSLNRPAAGDPVSLYLASRSRARIADDVYCSVPEFQLYGQTLAPQTWRLRGNMLMAAPRMMKAEGAAEATESAKLAMNDMAYDAVAVATSGVTEESADENDMGSGSTEPDTFAYRDSETPLALFRPMLATGRDGNLELSFTVPDANTSWMFQALAFTDDMRTASISVSVLASKPVMVKPNLPRFLREGDRAVVLTSVMNATDSVMPVDVTIEIFNPATGEVVSRAAHVLEVAGNATEIISSQVDAPLNATMIGFRVKASTKLFADGEQSIIPILPAATRVIDSEPFYMGADTDESVITLPGANAAIDGVTTLEFCGNPIWYVVTALPGLAASEPATAPQASGALFSASVARGLVSRYPAIAEALKEWTANGADNVMLASMLERNDDLKTMLLQATPWVMDARTDTERMQRLALLFDSNRIDRNINDAINLLDKLQLDSGGWAWIAQTNEVSQWATNTVLSQMALLESYGFLPGDSRLTSMIDKAVNYIDREAERAYAANPSQPQTAFTALRSMFPSVKASVTVEKILGAATQTVVSDWKKIPLESRPGAAMLLWRRNYRSVASEILESLREFMVTDPDKGTYFPSLQNSAAGYITYTSSALRAFALIEPGAPEIDGLRHWLVVQKQATDWGASPETTEVIAAILSSSANWIGNIKGVSVKVNGKSVATPETDKRIGYFRMPLDIDPDREVKIAITRKSATPAWGAVMRSSMQPIQSVNAAGSPDLSIEKSIIGPDTLRAGDKVTVRLLINVGRNLNYVAITDERAACFEPVNQLPHIQVSEGVTLYVEPRSSRTSIFVTTMPKGTYVVSYDLYVNNAGSFASGIAEAASQYAPEITARSAGSIITVNSLK